MSSKTTLKNRQKVLLPLLFLSFAALPALADYPSTVSSLGPLGYWRLNEPAAVVPIAPTGTALNLGSLGTNANGTYYCITDVGGGPSGVTGDIAPFFNPNPALHASNPEFVEVPNSAALLSHSSMSIEFWVRRDNLSGSGAAICGGLDTGGGTDYKGFVVFLDNANSGTRNYFLRVRCSTGGNTEADLTNLNYNSRLYGLTAGTTLGEWDHVVYTWDATTVQGYINGVALTPNTFPAGKSYHPSTNQPLRFAMDSKPTLGLTLAKETWLAHAAVYSSVLTPERVTAHFTAASENASNYETAVLADSPLGYWKLNEAGPFPAAPKNPVTCVNLGSWGAGANGTLTADGDFDTGATGIPYASFAGATAANFTGTGSKLVVPAQSLTTSEFTISAWAKIPAQTLQGKFLRIPTTDEVWFGNSLGNSPGMFNNEVRCTFTGGSGSPSSIYMPSDEWAFVAWVHSDTESTIYVNGLSVASGPPASIADFSSTQLLFGDDFEGKLAEVAVFGSALTPTEVSSMFVAAAVPPPLTDLQMSGLDLNGDFSIAGTVGRGQTVALMKSTNLVDWTEIERINTDALTGSFSFPLNKGAEPKAFFRIE